MVTIGRAAAVLGVLALAVAWPRLAPEPPRLPPDEGIPLVSPGAEMPREAPRPRAKEERRPAKRPERRAVKRRWPAARRRVVKRRPVRRAVKTPAATAAPAPTAEAEPPTPQPRFTPTDPATTEFSFESGG